jgi:hypothetical protein
MTIVFAGGEIGAFTASDSNTHEATTSGTFDSAYARCGISSTGTSTTANTATFASSLAEGYLHWRMIHGLASPSFWVGNVQLKNSGGVVMFNLEYFSNLMRLYYYNGSGYTLAFSDIPISETGLCELDLYWLGNTASGQIRLYSSGSLAATSGTVNLSAVANVGSAVFIGGEIGSTNVVSEVIAASEPTIGWRLGTIYPTGAGSTNSFDSGTYAEVDETVYSDADSLSSGTANQIATFACNDLSPGGYVIKGVAVAARAKRGTTGPQSLQLATRTEGSNYFSATKALDVGYGAFLNIWETNPNTGIAWTETEIDAIEIGAKSIA